MIIKNNELQKLKATKCNLYLLYGENRGFKNQFIYENLSLEFKKNIFKYNENEVFNDYKDFMTSILNKSFFEEKKLYIISNVTEKILVLIEDFISSNIEDITIIIVASILDKRSEYFSASLHNESFEEIHINSDIITGLFGSFSKAI